MSDLFWARSNFDRQRENPSHPGEGSAIVSGLQRVGEYALPNHQACNEVSSQNCSSLHEAGTTGNYAADHQRQEYVKDKLSVLKKEANLINEQVFGEQQPNEAENIQCSRPNTHFAGHRYAAPVQQVTSTSSQPSFCSEEIMQSRVRQVGRSVEQQNCDVDQTQVDSSSLPQIMNIIQNVAKLLSSYDCASRQTSSANVFSSETDPEYHEVAKNLDSLMAKSDTGRDRLAEPYQRSSAESEAVPRCPAYACGKHVNRNHPGQLQGYSANESSSKMFCLQSDAGKSEPIESRYSKPTAQLHESALMQSEMMNGQTVSRSQSSVSNSDANMMIGLLKSIGCDATFSQTSGTSQRPMQDKPTMLSSLHGHTSSESRVIDSDVFSQNELTNVSAVRRPSRTECISRQRREESVDAKGLPSRNNANPISSAPYFNTPSSQRNGVTSFDATSLPSVHSDRSQLDSNSLTRMLKEMRSRMSGNGVPVATSERSTDYKKGGNDEAFVEPHASGVQGTPTSSKWKRTAEEAEEQSNPGKRTKPADAEQCYDTHSHHSRSQRVEHRSRSIEDRDVSHAGSLQSHSRQKTTTVAGELDSDSPPSLTTFLAHYSQMLRDSGRKPELERRRGHSPFAGTDQSRQATQVRAGESPGVTKYTSRTTGAYRKRDPVDTMTWETDKRSTEDWMEQIDDFLTDISTRKDSSSSSRYRKKDRNRCLSSDKNSISRRLGLREEAPVSSGVLKLSGSSPDVRDVGHRINAKTVMELGDERAERDIGCDVKGCTDIYESFGKFFRHLWCDHEKAMLEWLHSGGRCPSKRYEKIHRSDQVRPPVDCRKTSSQRDDHYSQKPVKRESTATTYGKQSPLTNESDEYTWKELSTSKRQKTASKDTVNSCERSSKNAHRSDTIKDRWKTDNVAADGHSTRDGKNLRKNAAMTKETSRGKSAADRGPTCDTRRVQTSAKSAHDSEENLRQGRRERRKADERQSSSAKPVFENDEAASSSSFRGVEQTAEWYMNSNVAAEGEQQCSDKRKDESAILHSSSSRNASPYVEKCNEATTVSSSFNSISKSAGVTSNANAANDDSTHPALSLAGDVVTVEIGNYRVAVGQWSPAPSKQATVVNGQYSAEDVVLRWEWPCEIVCGVGGCEQVCVTLRLFAQHVASVHLEDACDWIRTGFEPAIPSAARYRHELQCVGLYKAPESLGIPAEINCDVSGCKAICDTFGTFSSHISNVHRLTLRDWLKTVTTGGLSALYHTELRCYGLLAADAPHKAEVAAHGTGAEVVEQCVNVTQTATAINNAQSITSCPVAAEEETIIKDASLAVDVVQRTATKGTNAETELTDASTSAPTSDQSSSKLSQKRPPRGVDIPADPLPVIDSSVVIQKPGCALRYRCPAPRCHGNDVCSDRLLQHLRKRHGYCQQAIDSVYRPYFAAIDRARVQGTLTKPTVNAASTDSPAVGDKSISSDWLLNHLRNRHGYSQQAMDFHFHCLQDPLTMHAVDSTTTVLSDRVPPARWNQQHIRQFNLESYVVECGKSADPLPVMNSYAVLVQPCGLIKYRCPAPQCKYNGSGIIDSLSHLRTCHGYSQQATDNVYKPYFAALDRAVQECTLVKPAANSSASPLAAPAHVNEQTAPNSSVNPPAGDDRLTIPSSGKRTGNHLLRHCIPADPLPAVDSSAVIDEPGRALQYRCPAPRCERTGASKYWFLYQHLCEDHGYSRQAIEGVYKPYFDAVDLARQQGTLTTTPAVDSTASLSPARDDQDQRTVPSDGVPPARDDQQTVPSVGVPPARDIQRTVSSDGVPPARDDQQTVPSKGVPPARDIQRTVSSDGVPPVRDDQDQLPVPSDGVPSAQDHQQTIPSVGKRTVDPHLVVDPSTVVDKPGCGLRCRCPVPRCKLEGFLQYWLMRHHLRDHHGYKLSAIRKAYKPYLAPTEGARQRGKRVSPAVDTPAPAVSPPPDLEQTQASAEVDAVLSAHRARASDVPLDDVAQLPAADTSPVDVNIVERDSSPTIQMQRRLFSAIKNFLDKPLC